MKVVQYASDLIRVYAPIFPGQVIFSIHGHYFKDCLRPEMRSIRHNFFPSMVEWMGKNYSDVKNLKEFVLGQILFQVSDKILGFTGRGLGHQTDTKIEANTHDHTPDAGPQAEGLHAGKL